MTTRTLLILTILLAPVLAVAQITPVIESRYVESWFEIYNESNGDFYNDGDYWEAFNFEPFDAQIAPSINFGDTYCDNSAEQISSIESLALRAMVRAGAYAENFDPDVTVDSYSYSYYEVEFQIDSAHDFVFSGNGYGDGGGYGYGFVSLWDSDGNQPVWVEMFGGNDSYYEVGSLPAGMYTFQVDVAFEIGIWGAGGDGGEIELDVALELTPGASPVGELVGGSFLRAGPNPMTTATNIAFALGRGGPVALEVLDVRGRRVRTFEVDSRTEGTVRWDGRTDAGGHAPSGTYFLRARSGDELLQSKVTLVR